MDDGSKMDDVERLVSDLEGIMTDSQQNNLNQNPGSMLGDSSTPFSGITVKTEGIDMAGLDTTDPFLSTQFGDTSGHTGLKDINIDEIADITVSSMMAGFSLNKAH